MRILIVDDHEPLRKFLARLMTDAGHSVYEAEGAIRAKELLHSESIDLVVTDFNLGYGGTGEDIARTAKEISPNIRVLLISSSDQIRHFSDQFLRKPFPIGALLEFINQK